MTSRIKLNLPAGLRDKPTVELDGVDHAAAVRSLTLATEAGCLTQVTLNLAMVGAEVDGEARLYLSAAQVGLLARFGWLPPDHAKVHADGSVLLVTARAEEASQP